VAATCHPNTIHDSFTLCGGQFTPVLRLGSQHDGMADFLAVVGVVVFVAALLGLIWCLERV